MSLNVGMKIYSYCYGPMTVKSMDAKYVTASVDNSSGFSTEFSTICGNKDLNNITFPIAALGHWYFEKADDVIARKENNNFPEADQQAGRPKAMTRNDEYLHADFKTGSMPSGKETYPVEKKEKETYPIEKGKVTYPVAKN